MMLNTQRINIHSNLGVNSLCIDENGDYYENNNGYIYCDAGDSSNDDGNNLSYYERASNGENGYSDEDKSSVNVDDRKCDEDELHYNNIERSSDDEDGSSGEEEYYIYEDYYNYYENHVDEEESCSGESTNANETNESGSDEEESCSNNGVDYYNDDEDYENYVYNYDYEEYCNEADEKSDCEWNVDEDETGSDEDENGYDDDYENPEHNYEDNQEQFDEEEGESDGEETDEEDGSQENEQCSEDEYSDYENGDYGDYYENQEYDEDDYIEPDTDGDCEVEFSESGSDEDEIVSYEEDGQNDYEYNYLQSFDDEYYDEEDESESYDEESLDKDSSYEDDLGYEVDDISIAKQRDLSHTFFFRLYERLNDKLRTKFSVSHDAIKLATKKLIFNYKNLNRCETPEVINFDDKAICLGYLHRYAICHLGLVYHSILKACIGSTSFLSSLPCDELKVMCLGSGPGNDFFGFVFALDDCYVNETFIDVTVVDVNVGWEPIFSETVATVEEITNGKFGKLRKNFIQADITNSSSWDYNMRKKLKCADVITLVKVMSCIPKDDHLETLKNIVRLMKDDAFLIIIDCPLPSVELTALHHFLYPVYSSKREKFNFKEKKTRFGYPNISQCTAYIRVYQKRNSSQVL